MDGWTVGGVAGLIAALAFVLLVGALAYPLIKLGKVLDETRVTVRGLSDGTLPPAARDTLHFARDTAGTLLRKAAEHVREAKRIHDELEALCRPYVDFAAADALTERTLHELFPA